MEKSVACRFDADMQDIFSMREADIREYSPLALAFIGDGVYELVMRTLVMSGGNRPVKKLHLRTSHYVQAKTQSLMIQALREHLTEEEYAVYKRGRNANGTRPAKNQTMGDYRRATGFEALMGYLYLKHEWRRLLELVKTGLDSLGGK